MNSNKIGEYVGASIAIIILIAVLALVIRFIMWIYGL